MNGGLIFLLYKASQSTFANQTCFLISIAPDYPYPSLFSGTFSKSPSNRFFNAGEI
jgi:hypothetical protein